MEIKDITSNFNLSVMAVLSEPLKLSDVLFKMKEMGIEADETLPTQTLANPRMLRVGITNPGIRLTHIDSTDLYAYNLQYPKMLRGIFQLKAQIIQIESLSSDHFSEFKKFLSTAGYEDNVYFYEVIVNFETSSPGFLSGTALFPNLKTVDSPKLLTVRVFDGNVGEGDLREELWNEIQIEPIVASPSKVIVNAVYRKREVNNKLLEDSMTDIVSIFEKLKGVYLHEV